MPFRHFRDAFFFPSVPLLPAPRDPEKRKIKKIFEKLASPN
jgi:hypothetical protein